MRVSVLSRKVGASIAAVSVALAGCATSSKDVATAYVSPIQYQGYDCGQLASEAARLQTRISPLGGRLDEAASNDKALAGVSIILFWPAAFALGGTKNQEAEYSRLKGEYDAIQQAATAKKCAGIVPPTPTQAKPAAPATNTAAHPRQRQHKHPPQHLTLFRLCLSNLRSKRAASGGQRPADAGLFVGASLQAMAEVRAP